MFGTLDVRMTFNRSSVSIDWTASFDWYSISLSQRRAHFLMITLLWGEHRAVFSWVIYKADSSFNSLPCDQIYTLTVFSLSVDCGEFSFLWLLALTFSMISARHSVQMIESQSIRPPHSTHLQGISITPLFCCFGSYQLPSFTHVGLIGNT